MDTKNFPINEIREKLALLKERDHNFDGMHLTGSEYHHYELGKPLSEAEISRFEETHRIRIPEDYRNFISLVGCGPSTEDPNIPFGAGPDCGLIGLDQSIAMDHGSLDQDFPFPTGTSYDKIPENLLDEPLAGALIISFYEGVEEIKILLVVTGPEAGTIWVDDRLNLNGVFPMSKNKEEYMENKNERVRFLEWYMAWLDQYVKSSETFNAGADS